MWRAEWGNDSGNRRTTREQSEQSEAGTMGKWSRAAIAHLGGRVAETRKLSLYEHFAATRTGHRILNGPKTVTGVRQKETG